MDTLRFENSKNKILGGDYNKFGIGTLSEKTLHAVLKDYFEPHSDSQEIKIGNYVADIVSENGIIEIQTKQLSKLKDKLEAFLPHCPVVVVHPLIVHYKILRVDKNDGHILSHRSSPKRLKLINIFDELYGIRKYISNPNFSLCVCLIEADIIKTNETKKGKIKKLDTIPTKLIDEVYFNTPFDYQAFIPQGLSEGFTSAEFANLTHTTRDTALSCLNTLTEIGLIERSGKRGNAILFSTKKISK